MTHAHTAMPRRDRLALHFHYQQYTLIAAIKATGAALPLVLLVGPGILRYAGAAYAVVWALTVIPTTGIYLGLMLDAALMWTGRWPMLLPTVLQAVELRHRGHGQPSRRAARWLRDFMQFGMEINPLGNLAMAFLVVAMTRQRAMTAKLFREIEQTTTEELRVPEAVQVTTPQEQMEVLEHEVCPV